MEKNIILTSRGINTGPGAKLVENELKQRFGCLDDKVILLIFPPDELVEKWLREAGIAMGFRPENIRINTIDDTPPDVIYVTEGNTFEVLDHMRRLCLCTYVTELVRKGAVYVGSSAGAVIATEDIKIAGDFDSNFVRMWDYEGLGLVEGTVLPHFTQEQYERYLEEADPALIRRYSKIVPISNEEVLVLEPRQVP